MGDKVMIMATDNQHSSTAAVILTDDRYSKTYLQLSQVDHYPSVV